jgi:CBS domain-containing protein
MRVRDIMSTPVIGVTAEATIEEAAKLMMDRGFTTLPVFTGSGRLVGLLVESDLGRARYTIPEPTPEDGAIIGRRPRVVRQVMRAPAPEVPADAGLAELAAVMVESQQRSLPVVERGAVVGMVSWRDLLAHVAEDRYEPPVDAGRG